MYSGSGRFLASSWVSWWMVFLDNERVQVFCRHGTRPIFPHWKYDVDITTKYHPLTVIGTDKRGSGRNRPRRRCDEPLQEEEATCAEEN